MSPGRMHRVMQQLRHAALRCDVAERPDAELLHAFIEQRDESAFTALVRRHAAMVLGVCRRVTGDAHDAEDAFQAAFCVLLRKAPSIRRREVLGSWLYGVAYRTALAAKARRAKMRRREHQVDAMPQPLQNPPDLTNDWQPLLDAALERLPERYRAPIVLCDLDGKSRKEAALLLRLSEGTLSSRLARGRRLLAQRLQRHGVTLSGGALAALLAEHAAIASVPATLVHTVAQAGAQMIVGVAPTALAFSRPVLALTEGVMKAMLLGKLKTCSVVLLTCAALTLGGFWLAGNGAAQTPNSSSPGAPPPMPPAKRPTMLLGANRGMENCTSCHQATHHMTQHDPHGFAAQPEFRIEVVLTTDDGGKSKPLAAPAVTVARGQRASFAIDTAFEEKGKLQTAKIHWNGEVIRQRGNDVLISLTLEKKSRVSNSVVHGSSIEFEDFLPLGEWKTVTEPAWIATQLKIKVSAANIAPQPTAKNTAAKPDQPAANPFGALPPAKVPRDNEPAAPRNAEFTVFKLKHADAFKVAATLRDLLSDRVQGELSITVDDRTNSLLLRSNRTDQKTVTALLARLDVPPAAADGASAISPDGTRLAVGAKDDVLILDVRTGKMLSRTAGEAPIQSLAFSPDGKLLASGAAKGAVRLYDSATGKEVRRIETTKELARIEFAIDGQTKLTVLLVTTTEPAVHVWDVNTGKLLRVEKTKGEQK